MFESEIRTAPEWNWTVLPINSAPEIEEYIAEMSNRLADIEAPDHEEFEDRCERAWAEVIRTFRGMDRATPSELEAISNGMNGLPVCEDDIEAMRRLFWCASYEQVADRLRTMRLFHACVLGWGRA